MYRDSSAIIIITVILTILGLMVGYSVEGLRTDLQSFLIKQFILLFIGGGCFIALLFYDYHKLFKPGNFWLLSLICILGLIAVLFFGELRNGARRWLNLFGVFSLQPSEFAKIAFLINITWYLSRFYSRLKTIRYGIVLPIVITLIYCTLIILENDQGTPTIMMITVLCMIFVTGIYRRYLFIGTGISVGAFTFAVISKPHRIDRIIYTWFPEWDPSGKGWHIIQSLVSFYRGNILGVGIGAGEQKLDYLPEAHRDFPFSIIGEEMGILGTILIVILFLLLIYYGFEIARKSPDFQGSLLAIGITCMIGIQGIVMMLVNIGILPVKGMCLPLISSGGSSFIANMFMLGCLVNIGFQEIRKESPSYWKAFIFANLNNPLK
ncbi:MAG: FtsW/RodA/SpoVE family cell cycle protein [Candidatus Hydrogenedens sp.]